MSPDSEIKIKRLFFFPFLKKEWNNFLFYDKLLFHSTKYNCKLQDQTIKRTKVFLHFYSQSNFVLKFADDCSTINYESILTEVGSQRTKYFHIRNSPEKRKWNAKKQKMKKYLVYSQFMFELPLFLTVKVWLDRKDISGKNNKRSLSNCKLVLWF